jgi:hypothetical protein
MRHLVIALRHAGRAEGVGFDHVGAGSEIFLVNLADHVWLRQRQQLVVALQEQLATARLRKGLMFAAAATCAVRESMLAGAALEVLEALAAIILLGQLVLLDHRPHGAIQNQDALGQQVSQKGFGRRKGV